MTKKYDKKQASKIIAKSMWKSVKKAMAKNPIQDVVDSNFTAEAKPSSVPASSTAVMNKSKPQKLKGFLNQRQNKIKKKTKL